MAAFQYLDEDTIFDAFNDSTKYMRPLFEPFQEFERVARNRPYPGIDKAYPKVTDGTTAAVIQKTPRRIIQQLPTGIAHSDTNDWLTLVASFIFNKRIIINANSQYMFIQKAWNAVSKALTYGSQPAYVPFLNRGQYFGTDMTLPYIKDVFLEPGKLSDMDSNYILMRSWYQPRDIKALIAREKQLASRASDRKEKYESGWDLEALANIENSLSQKDDLSTTPNERDKNNRNGGIPIIHAFQRGIGGTFFSFHQPSKGLLRTKVNKDPRGEIPVHYLYADTDGSNPLGRGFVELVGAMQNLMDSEVQMYQYNRALMLNPPIIKRGDWSKTQAKFAPNTVWDLGTNPGNTAEALKIDSTALNNFPANYGLMKSQLINLLSSPNPDVSATSGNPGTSKTQAGVKNSMDIVNVDDNYIRKQTEAWLQRIFETQVNLYFAERSGIEELQLDSETAGHINDIQPGLVSPDEKIRINYDTETEVLNFKIDAGTSEKKDDAEEVSKLQEIINMVDSNPYSLQYLVQSGKNLNFGEVYKQLYEKTGLKDIDKILTDVPKDQNGQPMAPPPMAMDRPKLNIHYPDLPPAAQIQMLRNAGITVTEQDLMVGTIVDPNVRGRSDGQGGGLAGVLGDVGPSGDVAQHPLIQLMSSLNIKFTDLPEDSKQEVLGLLGMPSNQLSPTQQKMSIDAAKVSDGIHQGMESHLNAQTQMAQTAQTAQDQLAQADSHKQVDAQLQQQSQDQQAAQAAQQAQAQNPGTSPPSGSLESSPNKPTPAQVQPAQIAPAQAVPDTPPAPAGPAQAGLNAPQTSQPAQAPAGAQPSDNFSPEDHAYIAELKKMGLPDSQIGQALAMLHHGYPAEDVLKMLQGAKA